MFNQQELQVLVGGVDSPIDLDDLRANTQYGGLYDDHEPTIEIFWGVSHFVISSEESGSRLYRRLLMPSNRTSGVHCCVS